MPIPSRRRLTFALALLCLAACDSNSGRFIWEKNPSSTEPAKSGHAAAKPAAVLSNGQDDAEVAAKPDELVAFQGRVAVPGRDLGCRLPGFTPPAAFKLFAAGAYAGRRLDYQIDQSGHEATRIDVSVNHTAEPVILMLGAYEPTVWNIGWSPKTTIVAVLIGGYHRQVVAGLPKEVPVLVSTYDNKGACGYFYVSEDRVGQLNPIALAAFGKRVDLVHLAKDGAVAIGDPAVSTQLLTSARTTPDSFRDKDAPLAGEAGLQQAIQQGLLRPALREDMDAWALAQAEIMARRDVPPIAGRSATRNRPSRENIHNGYVVLRAMRIPAGLYGAHSATFFVPKGVPRPTGNPGHSSIYDFNTLACSGALCR